jgi:GT2 family glycosyltransferase/SAM-dependent methyltransferase
MTDARLISVVMIFHNADRFIREAIESVLAQTWQEWELILVDDGSTDDSAAIARHFAQADPSRVRCVTHPDGANHGMSASRNLGIAQARGEFLAFLDADDVWLPDMLEQQVSLLEARPDVGMVYGPAQWWFSWTGEDEDRGRDFIHELGVPADQTLEPPTLLTRFLPAEGLSPCTCSVLLRRRVAEQVGGFEPAFRNTYEDQVFFAKVSLVTPVYVSSRCLSRYRQHPESNATRNSTKYREARAAFLEWLDQHLGGHDGEHAEVQALVATERRRLGRSWMRRFAERVTTGTGRRLVGFARYLRMRSLALPMIRHLRAMQFRRLSPVAEGRQRGTPIVRHYWAQFLHAHREDIRGRALEIGTTTTLRRFPAVTVAEALDLTAHRPEVTVVADLTRADHVPSDSYDCFVVPNTTHVIADIESALHHAVRILRPGGILLVNFPCVDYYFPTGLDMGTGAPLFVHWWFTPIQVDNVLRRIGLGGADYQLEIFGNLFTRIAYQLNVPAEELTRRELDHRDPGHPLLICARVVKPEDWSGEAPVPREVWLPDVTPARWNPETGHYGRTADGDEPGER